MKKILLIEDDKALRENTPEADGYGVLQNLSSDEKTKQIPFIFLSAKTAHKEIRKGMDLGADDYLTKPRISIKRVPVPTRYTLS